MEFDGSKEEHMQRFNPFIKQNRLHVQLFPRTYFFVNEQDAKSVGKCKEEDCAKHRISSEGSEGEATPFKLNTKVAIFTRHNRIEYLQKLKVPARDTKTIGSN